MKTRPNYLNRQKRLADILISKGLDALLIKKKENIFYLTGSRGEDSL
ncbi:MAG: aminopeptidase P family N-terminal domain-containing protein, partial [Candidatus Omnitrophica bacterium]|nr:aminopeptidase P family N-terminal domain-containing protein [Candidatus Omnitrophota bacterium]